MSDFTLEQLVNIEQIQSLLEAHHRISGIPCGLMDNNEHLLVGVGLHDICTKFHWPNQKSFARCWRNDPDLKRELNAFTGELFECRCKNGMVNIVMPIVVEGRRLAVFFAGQFFYDDEPPDPAWFRSQAEELGFDGESYLAALRRVPLFSRTHVDNTMRFLHQLVQHLAETGHANYLRLREQQERMRTERKLLLFKRAMDASSETVFLMDSRGRFVYVNEEACRSLAYPRDKLLTMTPLDIDPDLTPESFGEMLAGLFTVGPTLGNFEARHRTRDGRVFPVELSTNVIDYDDERFGLVLARDISERKRLNQELLLLSEALNKTAEAVSLINAQFRFVYVNDTACGMLGYSREELLTMGPLDIDADVSLEEIQGMRRTLVETNNLVPFETRHRAKDSRIIPVEVSSSLFEHDGVKLIVSMARDISKRQRSEQQLKLLNHALDHVHEGAFLFDLQGRFLHVNRQACRSLGYSREELLGMGVPDVDPDYSSEVLAEHVAELLRQGFHTFESRHRTKAGDIFPVEITTSPFAYGDTRYLLALVRDISERKQLEAELAARERQFRTLAEHIPDLIVRYDTDLRRTYVNPAWEKSSGLSAAEVVNVPMTAIPRVPRPTNGGYVEGLRRVLASGNPETIEFAWTNSHGQTLFLEYRIVPEQDQQGRITGLLATGRDITALKTAQWELLLLKQAMSQVREAAYLASEDGHFVYVNDEACRFLGYSRAELLTVGVTDVDAELDEDGWRNHVNAMQATLNMTFERNHKTGQGDIVPVEISAHYFTYNGVGYILGLARDISERKWAEQVVRARLAMLEKARMGVTVADTLRLLLDEIEALTGSSIGFCHFLEKDQQTLTLQSWSTNTVATMCRAEGLGKHYPLAQAGVWADAVRQRRPVIHNDYAALPNRRGMPDGHAKVVRELVVPIFRDSEIVAIIGVGNKQVDYTDADAKIVSLLGDFFWEIVIRKQAEERLRESDERLRLTLEATQIGAWDWDIEHDVWQASSTVYYTMLGYEPQSGPGNWEEWLERVHPADRAHVAAIIDAVRYGKLGDYRYEARMRHADGTYRWQFVQGFGIERDHAGKVTRMLGIRMDINERKQAEQQLRLFNFAFDHVREAAFLIELNEGKFLQVNQEACRSLEYSRDELIGMSALDIDPNFSLESLKENIAELLKQGTMTFETCHRTRSGRLFPVELAATIFEYDGIKYSLALVRNITERKRSEDTLRFITQRHWLGDAVDFLASLAQHIGATLEMDYVIIARLAGDDPGIAETVALYAKGALLPSMRYALQDTPCNNVMGKTLCLYPDNIQALFPADTLLIEMGAESYAGLPLWDSAGQPIGLLAVLDGKPMRNEAEVAHILQLAATSAAAALERMRSDALQSLRERELRTLAENLPDNIIRYDREGRTVYVNPVLEKTLGIAAANLLGTRIREFYPDGSFEVYAQAVDSTLAGGGNGEIELVLPGSSEVPIVHQIRTIAERDEHGKVVGVLAIGRDITERKRAEQERLAHLRFFESLDRVNRAIQGAVDLETMMSDVLGAVLSIFGCDRAFLLYPCDPEATSWEIPMERTTADYSGAKYQKKTIPGSDAWLMKKHRLLLAAEHPVHLGIGSPHPPLPGTAVTQYQVKSVLATAIYPKVDQPWEFGIHQCSSARAWTEEEQRLFQEIGRRLSDGMTSLLMYRNLSESEARHRLIFENSPVSIWKEDFSGIKDLFDVLRQQGVVDIEGYFDRHPETVPHCAGLIKIIDLNLAALALHGAAGKEELFAGPANTFTPESFATFRRELVDLWHGKTRMTLDSVIKTLTGERREVTVYFAVCPGYETTLANCLVSLVDITERRQSERKIREHQQRLNDLALELSMSEERERRRLATDLHDTLGQELTLVRIKMGSLKKTGLSLKQTNIISEIKGLVESALNRVRRLTRQLCPPILESAGLEAGLKWLARQLEIDYALQITFDDDLQDKPVPREFQMELYNCVRELLINIAKHAGSAVAYVSVSREADMLVIRVEDDGVGFEADNALNSLTTDGFGLFSISRRIAYIGGSFQIISGLSNGTQVTIKVPLEGSISQGEQT